MTFDLFTKLWDLSNVFTGFAILQALAFLYATAQPSLYDQIRKPLFAVAISILTIVIAVGLVCALNWCKNTSIHLLKQHVNDQSLFLENVIHRVTFYKIVICIDNFS